MFQCSSSCGLGSQHRHVRCPGGVSKCDIKTKPATNRTCIGRSCLQWIVGEWGQCSVTCGNGSQSRSVDCEGGLEKECERDKKPPTRQACPEFSCPTWYAGNWSECSVTCGQGTQGRTVECEGIQPELFCKESAKPAPMRPCLKQQCSGWEVEEWGPCSTTCGEGARERKVVCTFNTCTPASKPDHKEMCNMRECAVWLTGAWNECSASCGEGKQYRNVTCNEDDALCPETARPTAVKSCVLSECSMWNLGNWSECSVSCGTGVQTRDIVCKSDVQSLCENKQPETERECHLEPCAEWKTKAWSEVSVCLFSLNLCYVGAVSNVM